MPIGTASFAVWHYYCFNRLLTTRTVQEYTKKLVLLAAVALVALVYNAKATSITFVGAFDGGNESPATIVNTANAHNVDDFPGPSDNNLFEGARVTSSGAGGTITNSFGTFEVTEISQGQEEFTFTISSGYVLAGLSVHGGGGTVNNYYSVNDETSGTNEGPVATGGGGGLSGLDFLLEAASVPDGGSTVMLLGSALTGLGAMRRFVKR